MSLTRRIRSITRGKRGSLVVRGLECAGIKYSRMLLYQRVLDGEPPSVEPIHGKKVTQVHANATDLLPESVNPNKLESSDEVITLYTDDDCIGYLWLSTRSSYKINPINRKMTIPDAYVWKVFVSPKYRREGVGTELLKQTVRIAHNDGYNSLSAFVAANNFPSRYLFEKVGFNPETEHRYLQIIDYEYRTSLDRR